MMKKMLRMKRGFMALLAMGTMVQMNGCSLDAATAVGGLVSSIANSLITDLVYGLFNVPV